MKFVSQNISFQSP